MEMKVSIPYGKGKVSDEVVLNDEELVSIPYGKGKGFLCPKIQTMLKVSIPYGKGKESVGECLELG